MDLEKLAKVGQTLGLEGTELQEFIKAEQDKAREARVEERQRMKEEKELTELKLKLEQARLEEGGSNRVQINTVRAPKLPAFQCGKDNLDVYLHRFERYANAQHWPRDVWAVHLSALLTGKALDTYSRLDDDEAQDYDRVKAAVLKRYSLTSDGFRRKFRGAKPETGETAAQFVIRIRSYLEKWLELSGHKPTFEEMVQLVLIEQFYNVCSKDMETFIKERQPTDIDDFVDIADRFIEARSGWHLGGQTGGKSRGHIKPESRTNTSTGDARPQPGGATTPRPDGCFICGKKGHIARYCRSRETRKEKAAVGIQGGQKPDPNRKADDKKPDNRTPEMRTGAKAGRPGETDVSPVSTRSSGSEGKRQMSEHGNACLVIDSCFSCAEPSPDIRIADSDLPLMSVACGEQPVRAMPVRKGIVNGTHVDVLRDSGCSTAVVRTELVRADQMTGSQRTCILIDGSEKQFPVATVMIDSPFFVGELEVLCMNNPVYDVILGNVAGVREPNDPDSSWQADSGLAVETRAQRREAAKPQRAMKVPRQADIATADEFRREQSNDESLEKIRQQAESSEVKTSRNGNQSRFIAKKGLLYREFRAGCGERQEVSNQLVVPRKYRRQILSLAHESILGGHLGAHKTTERILQNFFWPGIGADTVRYCRSCDVCQRSLQKGKVSKVPLGTTPLIDEPFHRVAVDLVGPIVPVTSRGNRYILTLMDYATRYPEAVPLRNIDTTSVAEALFTIFSRVGFPHEMLTDRGTQFMSDVMKEVSRLMSIRHITTTPYHPACNGLVEKFNGTMKQMLKKMCEERPQDWDRYIDALLFAYREAPQASTGFAPFELLYGRAVRRPLMIVKELWTDDNAEPETKSTYQYVMDLREKLEDTCKMVHEHLKQSHDRYREQYNRKARPRSFKVGDEVLLLLPTDHNKLLMHWKGPFKVVGKIGKLDYRIDLGTRTTTFHANLLKQYHRRHDEDAAGLVSHDVAGVSVIEEDERDEDVDDLGPEPTSNEHLIQTPTLKQTQTVADVKLGSTLSDEQSRQLRRLIGNFPDVLTDLPGVTNLGCHDIELTDLRPIKSRPYPLPHALRRVVDDEVKEMLDLGVIEASSSPYASPIVLVKKSDGTNRFCCDFRKLNLVTVPDAEPIPDQDEIFAQLANDNYFSKLDLTKGYWQVPLTERAKPLTAFVTPNGLYQFRTMPFGLINAPASFSRIMRQLLRGMECVHNFIDDILVHTTTWEKHLKVLRELFKRLRQAGLKAKPSKCLLGQESLEFLGHQLGRGKIQPRTEKVEAIKQAERPRTKRQLRSFLGLANYYRKFVPNFAALAVPLTDLTRKGEPNQVRWGEAQENAFKCLKGKIANAPILHLPDVDRTFFLRTDASENGIGAVLLQEFDDEKFPVAFASKKLLDRERRYSTIERECLAVIWAVQKFEPYLYGKEFVLEVDHEPLLAMRRGKLANGRVMQWALALQPFRYRIEAIKGKENVGADYMSRIQHSPYPGTEYPDLSEDVSGVGYRPVFESSSNPTPRCGQNQADTREPDNTHANRPCVSGHAVLPHPYTLHAATDCRNRRQPPRVNRVSDARIRLRLSNTVQASRGYRQRESAFDNVGT
ncbi:uncharacterized protein [Diadema antillarum]|uniref:uncharacterized protein n=1 Tax=Diadema antillarum TaxID=105358 RepID=UPI003A885B01